MRFSSALFVLASISQVMGMIAFGNLHYSAGKVSYTTTTWTDAPSSYNLAVVDSTGKATVISSGVSPTPGGYSLSLPNLPAGTYRLQAQSTDGSQIYTTSSGFSVAATDFASSVTAAAITVTSTGTVRILLTTSAVTVSGSASIGTFTLTGAGSPATPSASGITAGSSSSTASGSANVTAVTSTFTTGTTTSVSPVATTSLFTTNSVITSGSVTTTVSVTGSITATVTPSSSSGAATATTVATTTRSSGFKSAGVHFGLPVAAGVLLGALLL